MTDDLQSSTGPEIFNALKHAAESGDRLSADLMEVVGMVPLQAGAPEMVLDMLAVIATRASVVTLSHSLNSGPLETYRSIQKFVPAEFSKELPDVG